MEPDMLFIDTSDPRVVAALRAEANEFEQDYPGYAAELRKIANRPDTMTTWPRSGNLARRLGEIQTGRGA